MAEGPDEGAHLRALAALLPSAWLLEGADGRVVASNAALCDLFHLDGGPAGLEGRAVDRVLARVARTAVDPEAFVALAARCRTEGLPRRGDEVGLVDDRVVEMDYAPVPLAGGRRGHVWHFRDVTASRTHVDALRRAVIAAEQASEDRRRFLAGMSHEIRTPVNAIIGMTELVSENTLDGDVRHLVDGVQRNATRLLRLIERLLAFTGSPRPAERVEVGPFSPLEVVESVVAGQAAAAEDAGLVLLCRRGPDVPARTIGDRVGVEQLVEHLAGFAVQSGSPVVEVGVDVRLPDGASLSGDGEGGPAQATVVFFVRDRIDRREVGEPEAILDRVFWRGRGAQEEVGLGRQVVFGLVERVGGTLAVRPGPDGTLFELRCEVIVERWPRREEPLAGRTVLIADPEPERRALHAEECIELGASIRTAADVDAMHAIIAAGAVDCALVTDPLSLGVPGLPWVRLAPAGRLDAVEPTCVWRLGLAPQRRELVAALGRCGRVHDGLEAAGPARVLVIEDLPDNEVVLRRFLESAGHRVHSVESGSEGLMAMRGDAWDVVLMDINLPDMDGVAVTREIRAFEARAHLGATPVVAVTAYATDDMRQAAAAAGMQAFVIKPVDRGRVLAAVARYGRRGQVGLIVDDDPVGRLLLMRRVRRRASLRPRWAADAADARAVADREQVSFAIIDASLPDQDGLALAREFIARGIRCALVTDQDGRTTREGALRAGCLDVLTKPVRAEAVARAIAHLCTDTGALTPVVPRR